MPEPTIVSKQSIEQLFDGAAAAYDCVGPSLFARWGARLVELMTLEPGAHVLDVATGRGAVLLPAAQCVGPGGHVVGIDLSAAMVEEATAAARNLAPEYAEVTLRKMDAEHLDFPDARFDAVACAFAIFLFPAQDTALREMARVCKPDGRIGLSVFGRTPPPFDPGWSIWGNLAMDYGVSVRLPQRATLSPDNLEALLNQNDFRDVQITSEMTDAVYINEEDWWAFQFTLGTRATILAMDDATRTQFKKEYLAKIRPLFRADGLHLPVNILYALTRPCTTSELQHRTS